MIRICNLTKRYGDVVAVDDVTFDVRPGAVTGFLGPNGAGKSTTMRIVLSLDRPTAGTAYVNGKAYRTLSRPLREVGAVLDVGALHGGRTGRNLLRVAARSNGIAPGRVDEVLGQVGLEAAAGRRVKGYSLGMRQRLGIAAALLGDPGVLLFDEPVNGLDVDGVRWVRGLVRGLAREGRTVLVSSHLMSEMQQTADHLVVIVDGRLVADAPVDAIVRSDRVEVVVRTPGPDRLEAGLAELGLSVRRGAAAELRVFGATAEMVGDTAERLGVPLHGLTEVRATLEDAYLELTGQAVRRGAVAPAVPGAGPEAAR